MFKKQSTPTTAACRAAALALAPLHQKLRAMIQRRDELTAEVDKLREAEQQAVREEARIAEAFTIGEASPAELTAAADHLAYAKAAVSNGERLAGLAAAAAVRAGDDVLAAEVAAEAAHRQVIREAAEQAAEEWREVCRQWGARLALARLAVMPDQDPARILESVLSALPRDLAAIASVASIEPPPRTVVPRDILEEAASLGTSRRLGWMNHRRPEERA